GAGLCVRTFASLKDSPVGFRVDGVLLFSLVDPPSMRYPQDRIMDLFKKVDERVRAIPGVQSTTFSLNPVLSGRGATPGVVVVGQRVSAHTNSVGNHFFETMGIPILYGRAIDDGDIRNGLRAVVVNQEFARRLFREENSVGKTFTDFRGTTTFQVVGVSKDARLNQLREPLTPAFYAALAQDPPPTNVTFE